ncbi:unnamed protein product [Discosporangium mesarthrocarpum]
MNPTHVVIPAHLVHNQYQRRTAGIFSKYTMANMAPLIATLATSVLAAPASGFVAPSTMSQFVASSSTQRVTPGAGKQQAKGLQMVAQPPVKPAKLDKVNILKQNSHSLRDPLRSEMATEEIFINHDAYQILKFHGSYMQDNRDMRTKGAQKDYSFMLRLKMPAGVCTAELFTLLDNLSNEYGHGHLRLTTRQTFQLHGVAKHNLKHVIKAIMDVGGSTVGGCGDVNRNIMCTPAPLMKPEYVYARQYTKTIAELLRPLSSAFSELWLDGEKAATVEFWRKDMLDVDVDAAMLSDNGRGIILNHPTEPLYGDLYLPRKFKIGVTVPGDNSVDLYTNDIGLIAITSPNGDLEGFNVAVGGGLGRTHNKETTFARAADHMGFVPKEDILEHVKAILAAQRDHGNREVRANARMKYLVHTLGINRFRQLVESYSGKTVQPWRPIPEWRYSDWLGWHEQGDGKWFLGVNVENGRVIDRPEEGMMLKTALRAVTDKYHLTMVCTPNQSVLLKDILPEQREGVEAILTANGIKPIEQIDPLLRLSMACPALPMCGLAITEAERRMPSYIERIRAVMDRNGLGDEEVMIRMTGCPNGCARPYMAELAFVGDGPNSYQVWLGGSPGNTRTAYAYAERVKDADMEKLVEPILRAYKQTRQNVPGKTFPEAFGDWCHRLGKEGVTAAVS